MTSIQKVSDMAANKQRILVPSYFPAASAEWERLVSTASQTGVLAILNPDSGPGKVPDPGFQAVAAKCTQGGVGMLGYVHTQYGKRPLADVVAEIDMFYQWYPVAGIFFDEVATDEDSLVYYTTLHRYVKTKPALVASGNSTAAASLPQCEKLLCYEIVEEPWVVINPGTSIPESYLDVCDIAVTFENHWSQYANWKPQKWEKHVPASRFAHLVYGATSDADMLNIMAQSQKNRAGHVYVTNLTLPNPWLALPSGGSWDKQVQAMQECDCEPAAGAAKQRSFLSKAASWLKG